MIENQNIIPNYTPFIIKLENLPKKFDEIFLAEIFSNFNISNQGIHLVFDHLNEFTGEAFIEFLTLNDVKNALKIELKIEKEKDEKDENEEEEEEEEEKSIKIKESSGFEFLVACGLIDSIPQNSGKFTPNSTKSLKLNGIKTKITKNEILKYFESFELQKTNQIEFIDNSNIIINFISDQEALRAFFQKNEGKIGKNLISLSFY